MRVHWIIDFECDPCSRKTFFDLDKRRTYFLNNDRNGARFQSVIIHRLKLTRFIIFTLETKRKIENLQNPRRIVLRK